MNPGLAALTRYFFMLGATCFGGFAAQAEAIHEGLVEKRGWVTPEEYARGLTFSSVCPGPVGSQLVVYLARIRLGVIGAALCSAAFLFPAFALTLAAAALYSRYSGLSAPRGVLSGTGAAVLAVLLVSVARLARGLLKNDAALWIAAGVTAAAQLLGVGHTATFALLSGASYLILKGPPLKNSGAAATGAFPVFFFFLKSGTFLFGTGMAILGALRADVVGRLGWVTSQQFLDALSVGLVTPGPILMAVAFMGFLAAGPLGALAAAGGMFLPVFTITVVLAPMIEKLDRNPSLKAFVAGASAAAIGAIAASILVLSRGALSDGRAALVCACALAAICLRRVSDPVAILGGAIAGLLLIR